MVGIKFYFIFWLLQFNYFFIVFTDGDGDALFNEENELTDQTDTDVETESEPEEDDVIIKEQKRIKSKYLDDEAEDDDDYDDDDGNEEFEPELNESREETSDR